MALGVIGRHQAQCSFEVDRRAPPPLRGPLLREIIPGLCTGSRRCPTGRDEAVVGRSDADLAAFLARVFAASG